MKHWRLIYLSIPLTALVFGLILWSNSKNDNRPCEGIGRVPSVARYCATVEAVEIKTAPAYDEYTEGEGDAPEWWKPEEPMAAEWEEPKNADLVLTVEEESEVVTRDAGCPDWNVDSTLWGWDGHGMEVWEMDLFSRIVYLEFWGTSEACVEAGIDSMLLLWNMGEYGRTMGELLSAQYAPGYYVYSPYAYVWDWTYDAQALAEIRTMCEERFVNGPKWCAPYFRLWYYHEWAVPAYEIDGVYFSTGKGW